LLFFFENGLRPRDLSGFLYTTELELLEFLMRPPYNVSKDAALIEINGVRSDDCGVSGREITEKKLGLLEIGYEHGLRYPTITNFTMMQLECLEVLLSKFKLPVDYALSIMANIKTGIVAQLFVRCSLFFSKEKIKSNFSVWQKVLLVFLLVNELIEHGDKCHKDVWDNMNQIIENVRIFDNYETAKREYPSAFIEQDEKILPNIIDINCRYTKNFEVVLDDCRLINFIRLVAKWCVHSINFNFCHYFEGKSKPYTRCNIEFNLSSEDQKYFVIIENWLGERGITFSSFTCTDGCTRRIIIDTENLKLLLDILKKFSYGLLAYQKTFTFDEKSLQSRRVQTVIDMLLNGRFDLRDNVAIREFVDNDIASIKKYLPSSAICDSPSKSFSQRF